MGDPGAASFLAASGLWLLLGVLPGYLLATALGPERAVLDRVAVAPLVSVGICFATAAWAGSMGVPGSVWVGTVALVATSLAAGTVVLGRLDRLGPRRAWSRDRRRTWIVVGLSVGAALVIWTVAISASIPGWAAAVPSTDGATHGLWLTEILRSGSLFPSSASPLAPVGGTVVAASGPAGVAWLTYPLGVHALAAPVAAATTVSSALLVPLTWLASASAVLGVVALTRRFASPVQALVAGACSAVLVPLFPFWNVYWGPVPMMLAVALVPAAAIAVLEVGPRLGLVIPSLALAGLFSLHVTEVLVVAALVVLRELAAGRGPDVGPRRRRMLGALGAALLLCWPLTAALVLGPASARPADPSAAQDAASSLLVAVLHPYVVLERATGLGLVAVLGSAVVLVVLACLGARRAWARPLGRATVLVVAATTLLSAAASALEVPFVTVPWYGNPDRLVVQAAALMPCLLGIGVVDVSSRVTAVRGRLAVPVLGAAAVVALVMAVQAVVVASSAISDYSVVTPADREAYRWLAAHASPGHPVLNDEVDGSVWMYEATGGSVVPLVVRGPRSADDQDVLARLDLVRRIHDVVDDPAVRAEARRWGVRYVVVGERVLSGRHRTLDVDAVASSSGLRLVFESGGARVYEIVAT